MSLKILLTIICFSLYADNGFCVEYMGDEESLRQNLGELLNSKLKFSQSALPYGKDELADTTPKNQSEYDFIVIGAGSAGATIASRLTEVKNVTVLLIEAGDIEYSIMDIPSMAEALWTSDEINWKYPIESSDKYCLSNNGMCIWYRGKVVGGSSTINYNGAMRGNRRDYDEWAEITGDKSWSYKSMLKYFKKLENFDVKGGQTKGKFHNKGGPVHITGPHHRVELTDAFIEAGKEMGYSEVDYNGPEQIGFSYYQSTIFKGERWSANRAYLRPAKNRNNLFLTRNSYVQKILINSVTKDAYAVRFSKNRQIYEVKARKEIILSAGTISSPQILMLSGVGPSKHLREFNVKVIKDAPVGKNLIDHIAYGRSLRFTVNDTSSLNLSNILDPEDPSIRDYINSRSGLLSYGASLGGLSYLNVHDPANLHPNIEMTFSPGGGMITNQSIAPENLSPKAFAMMPMILKPRSRGRILLRSNNPFDKPKIYPNYLADPDDVKVLTKAIRMGIKIGKTNAFKKHGSHFQRSSSPCDSHGVGSDAYWECELRTYTLTMYHPVGTCKMGRENSSTAVVNSRLKVIGIKRLRVADSSIMPNTVCAHTNIPTIAIAEKAADLIKIEHGYNIHT